MTARAGPSRWAWPAIALLLIAPQTLSAANIAAPVKITGYREIHEHLIASAPVVATPWTDITAERRYSWWSFDVTVDENGAVVYAWLKKGAPELRDEATRAAQATRFKPFIRDGRPVRALLEMHVNSRVTDYQGPADRSFPSNPDPSSTVVVLSRTNCLGTCPSYRVELHGNGDVFYRGDSDVLVLGSHRWQVDPASLVPLLELFRRADYFTLKGYYEAPVFDLPTYITRLSVGERHKFVLDYGSSWGEAMASTSTGGEDPQMPEIVSEIEQAIDAVAGTASYVDGDDKTLQRLRAERWNFRSQDAGHGLRQLLRDCRTTLAREFITAGAPLDVRGEGRGGGLPIGFAPRCADIGLVQLMIDKGALKRRADARGFLWTSVWSGQPGMVALALKYDRDINRRGQDGTTMLAEAAGTYVNEEDPGVASFDQVKVIELLLAAGADPNARDDEGKTPIFEANEPAVVTALVRGGADPSARDNYGRTALFEEYFAEIKAPLIAAGVDPNARDKNGRTALFYQDYPDGITALLEGGADIGAVDSEGRTALEKLSSQEAALALLSAGAKLPTDPARLQAMIARATEKKWTEVLTLLEAAAAK
jgi:hypothetical protein